MIVDRVLALLPWLLPALLIGLSLSVLPLGNLAVLCLGALWAFLVFRYREDNKLKEDKEALLAIGRSIEHFFKKEESKS